MPFKSNAQRRFMYAEHPAIAKRWSKEYPNQGKLPDHVRKGIAHDHSIRQLHHELGSKEK